ncbi:hypothetical protein [Metabacillus sediminilitoris]|uniref:hypothetical protein n=1 Tax=Metabacillus sediminilitoris TaxID=2567941 RepID=UPI001454C840|nr:hypothetical protein [Metabacillus sediminilitoris]
MVFSASRLNTLHLSFGFDGDAANLMIKHGWFERAPQAIDRKYLAKVKTICTNFIKELLHNLARLLNISLIAFFRLPASLVEEKSFTSN